MKKNDNTCKINLLAKTPLIYFCNIFKFIHFDNFIAKNYTIPIKKQAIRSLLSLIVPRIVEMFYDTVTSFIFTYAHL